MKDELPTVKIYLYDRFPNVNGDYEPDNTRWATNSQQMRNTRESAVTEDYDEHKKQRLALSRYLNSALKFDKGSKLFFVRFGISLINFRKYIESQFLPGMTWENHGLGLGTGNLIILLDVIILI